MEITFNYEIRHESNVKWNTDEDSNEESSDNDGSWFSKLFGGRMLSNETSFDDVEWTNSSGSILEQLENVIVTSIWDAVLKDPDMTFDNSTGGCAGLVASEEDETLATDDVNSEFQPPTFETKLLGLSEYPADAINPDGEPGLFRSDR